jgi:hypothetical protein
MACELKLEPVTLPLPTGMLTAPLASDSGIITPSLALESFNTYFDKPDAPLRGAIVSVYQAGGANTPVSTLSHAQPLTTP